MTIKNFTQFVNLLSANKMIHLHPSFDRLVTCMMVYNGMCSCGGNSNREKVNKHGECNRIYKESVMSSEPFKPYFFQNCTDNSISFYLDEIHLIKTLIR
jgi:hypothetical protein